MLTEIKDDAKNRMVKAIEAFENALRRIRTGRAHPSLLDEVMVSYYGTPTQLKQLANVGVEDGRTITVTPWEKSLLGDVDKAIRSSNLGLNPSNNGDIIRVPLPALTEDSRRDLLKVAKGEAENAKIAVRNARREANNDVKELLKEKEITEDEQRRSEEDVQKLTDKFVKDVDTLLADKEKEIMTV